MTFKRGGSRKLITAPGRIDTWPSRAHWRKAGAEGGIVAGRSIRGQPNASAAHRDHLVSARRFTSHDGIYAGNGQVIHYGGLASGLQAGPVKVSPLVEFLADHPYKLRLYKTRTYSREESVERARARIGEDLYHPAFNNCEHFVTWCITGKTRSTQVDLLFGLTGGAWGLLLSRSGPVLHALYRWIRSNFQTPQK